MVRFTNVSIVFLLVIVGILSCKKNKAKGYGQENDQLGIKVQINTQLKTAYNFENPEIFYLTNSLEEISGLSFANGAIFTHNDEEGIIFKIDPTKGAVMEEIRFGEDADYEGIEVISDKAIVVKSNGNLTFYDFDTRQTKIQKNALKTENDVEAICLLNKDQLLLGCKGQLLNDDLKHNSKGIYSYDLHAQKLDKKPFLLVHDDSLEWHVKNKFKTIAISKKKRKKLQNRAMAFAPSGIAIHPETKDIYITSAKGNLVVIYNPLKQLKDIIFLNEKQLPQPEGICFDNLTNLYISTETKGTLGRIYKYRNN